MKFKFDDDYYSPKHSSSTLVPSLTPCNFPCNFLFNETLLPPEAWIALQDGPGIYFKQTNKQTCEGPCHVIISEEDATTTTTIPLPPGVVFSFNHGSYKNFPILYKYFFPSMFHPVLKQIKARVLSLLGEFS
ncbi:hypothetical protein CEXT_655991 [Caerostris extrusa]|uniref:Uncharacterized protein n=1 Tax=Caerostris extrusa TaxID=172846 RepID=A0AAV4YBH8_CAEEX|nr:hypothetical protein CEXT_655991 [Caerostris extrusa]